MEVRDGYLTYNLDESQAKHYKTCLKRGCSNSFAIMLALRSPPAAKSDREFGFGFGANESQFAADEKTGNQIVAATKKKDPGFSPRGKVYIGTLARETGDPEAWVDRTSARSDVKRIIEQRGWSCSGMVESEGRAGPPEENKKRLVAHDLVAKEAAKLERENPKLKGQEAMEAACEKLGGEGIAPKKGRKK